MTINEVIKSMAVDDPDLKPCPFCGGKAELMILAGVYVKCSRCFASSHEFFDSWDGVVGSAKVKAVRAWNRRVGE